MRRTAAANWVDAWGLPAACAARWSRPPVGVSGGSGAGPALMALSIVSRAVLRLPYAPGGPALLDDPDVTKALSSITT